MAIKNNNRNPEATTAPSKPADVNAYMLKLDHPMKETAQALREAILSADNSVGEEIYWNAPSFFYTGKMEPFPPKEYRRFIVVFNFFKKDCLRLIFLRGKLAGDKSGLLEGNFKDERKMALFYGPEDVKAKKKDLQLVVKSLVELIKTQS